MRYKVILALLLGVWLFAPTASYAVAITDLPGFVGIQVCFVLNSGSTLCEGVTRSELLAQNYTFNLDLQPIPIRGGIGGIDDDLGHGREFLVLSILGTGCCAALLDSIQLNFDATQRVSVEYANVITTTGGLVFGRGFSVGDLSKTLGPRDGGYVHIGQGSLVFGFASTTPAQPPTPVPEPATFPLLAVGILALGFVVHVRSRKKALPASATVS